MGIRSATSPSQTNGKMRVDLPFFDNIKRSVLIKATAVKNDAGSPTIGPLAGKATGTVETIGEKSPPEENGCQDLGFGHCTSTPISRKIAARHSTSSGKNISKLQVSISQISPVINEDEPTITRQLLDYERCRVKNIEEAMRQRIEALAKIENELAHKRELLSAEWQAHIHSKDLSAHEALLLQLEEEERLAEERRQQVQQQKELQAKRETVRNERLKAAEQKKKEEEEERRIKRAEKLKQLEEMQQIQQNYRLKYQAIFHFIRSAKDKQEFMNHYSNLKSYNEGMEQLIQQCKENVSAKDVERGATFLKQLGVIHDDIKSKIEEQLRREEEERQKEIRKEEEAHAEEIVQQQIEEQKESVAKPVPDARKVGDALSDCVEKVNLQVYLELIGNQQQVEKSYEQLVKDESLKKFRFECQKAINTPVNAISPTSATHLSDKLSRLSRLLSGKAVATSDNAQISASGHPAGIAFCTDLLAKKIVRQGDSTVSSKPEAAFAIAAVIVALWQEFPSWGQLVIAHFYNECPYLVPFFKPQLEGQTTKDYYKSLGYRYSDDGEVEKQDKFLKRMSGLMRLYAAIMITSPPRSRRNIPHPHGLQNGWRWLASILNLEPRPDICATLIYDFLEVAGQSMYQQYGRQFQKLLVFLCKEYFPLLHKASGSTSGPVVRLETFLQQILREGRIERPAGTLRPDFW